MDNMADYQVGLTMLTNIIYCNTSPHVVVPLFCYSKLTSKIFSEGEEKGTDNN